MRQSHKYKNQQLSLHTATLACMYGFSNSEIITLENSLQLTLRYSFHKKNEPKRIKQASPSILRPFIGKFLEHVVKRVEKGAGLLEEHSLSESLPACGRCWPHTHVCGTNLMRIARHSLMSGYGCGALTALQPMFASACADSMRATPWLAWICSWPYTDVCGTSLRRFVTASA